MVERRSPKPKVAGSSPATPAIFTMKQQKLNIINKKNRVIGVETRKKIHIKGLLHQEVHVWFYTPKGEIIFQHRAKDKDTFPDLLDATVGGHVEIGDNFESTAIKEALEETGIAIKSTDLTLIELQRHKSFDDIRQMTNNVVRALFIYKYEGKISELLIEEGKSEGFEAWHIDDVINPTAEQSKKLIPDLLQKEWKEFFCKIQKVIDKD